MHVHVSRVRQCRQFRRWTVDVSFPILIDSSILFADDPISWGLTNYFGQTSVRPRRVILALYPYIHLVLARLYFLRCRRSGSMP
ncbi:hypothetical protein EDD18DRAFT_1153640 [Armillaria luteobubalina]|uniref:Uncharacterized protein n=1 Tax=Armillaria luteobubalina TaxID=153913 RepID=A0AA39QA42_9AGAR|nr:hypothetical protein EDD18DRAFT_1153640 [Armillaria luteobubalina]